LTEERVAPLSADEKSVFSLGARARRGLACADPYALGCPLSLSRN
jgi:hypothetical protein